MKKYIHIVLPLAVALLGLLWMISAFVTNASGASAGGLVFGPVLIIFGGGGGVLGILDHLNGDLK